jgi:hypothetical protein
VSDPLPREARAAGGAYTTPSILVAALPPYNKVAIFCSGGLQTAGFIVSLSEQVSGERL